MTKMKLLFAIASLFICSSIFAQKFDTNKRHEFQFSAGPTLNISNYHTYSAINGSYFPYNTDYNSAYYYVGEKNVFGAVNLAYYYNFNRHFALGGTFSYLSFRQNYYSETTDEKMGHFNESQFGLTPKLRFMWLRKTYVQLYSGAGASIYFNPLNEELKDLDGGTVISRSTNPLKVLPIITLFGMSVGKGKIYGFSEINLGGITGLLLFGVGYRL